MFFETFLADEVRYAYARSPRLAALFKHRATIDAVVEALDIPIAYARRGKLSDAEARAALKRYVAWLNEFEFGSWHGVSAPEIAAAAVVRSNLPSETRALAFPAVEREADLAQPVVSYMRKFDLKVYAEVDTGRKRADLLGHYSGLLGERTVIVELKNALADFERGMDQVSTYAGYAHEVWVACTPALAASYLDAHSRGLAVHSWDPKWLEKKLGAVGCGLLLVEDGHVYRVQEPRKNRVDAKNRAEILAALNGRSPLSA